MFSKFRHLLLLLTLASCNVLEDRSQCPCFLTLDLKEVDSEALSGKGFEALGIAILENGSTAGSEAAVIHASAEIGLGELPESVLLDVPKTAATIAAVCCSGGYEPGEPIVVKEGNQCPAIYSYAKEIDLSGPSAVDTVRLHKNYAVAYVHLSDETHSYLVYEMYGDVCGCEADFTPLQGEFRYELIPDRKGLCSARLPRQTDNSLKLNVYSSGVLERSFAIGEYIAQSGYDWTAADLEDFTIDVNWSETKVTFKIDGWRKSMTFTIVL